MRKTHSATAAALAGLAVWLLTSGAQGCEGAEARKPGDPVRNHEVVMSVSWMTNPGQRSRNLPIEITLTWPNNMANLGQRPSGRSGHYDRTLAGAIGERFSVTADQQESGFLSCVIKVDGKLKDYTHRNDGGNVTCSWTIGDRA